MNGMPVVHVFVGLSQAPPRCRWLAGSRDVDSIVAVPSPTLLAPRGAKMMSRASRFDESDTPSLVLSPRGGSGFRPARRVTAPRLEGCACNV